MLRRCSDFECVRQIPVADRSWVGSTAGNARGLQATAENVRACGALESTVESQRGIVPEDATAGKSFNGINT